MPGLDGLQLMESIHKVAPQQEVILLTGREDPGLGVNAMRSGASDFLQKPLDEHSLLLAMERAKQRVDLQRERTKLLDENLEFVKAQVLYRRCLDMLSTLDLERLQESVLADLCAVCDAQSGALWVVDDRGELQLRSYRGLVNRARLAPRVETKKGPYAEGLASRAAFQLDTSGKEFFLPLWAGNELVAMALLPHLADGTLELRTVRTSGRSAMRLATCAVTARVSSMREPGGSSSASSVRPESSVGRKPAGSR